MLHSLLIVAFLLFFSAFFSGAETALFSLSPLERKRILTSHPKQGVYVERLLAKPRRTLITILIGNVLVNTLASLIVTLTVLERWGAEWLSLVTVIFALFLVWVGEIIPKLVTIRHNDRWATSLARPLNIFAICIWPLRKIIRFAADRVLNIISKNREHDVDGLSEGELETLIGISGEEGVVDADQTRMIGRLLALGDRQVREIMTPRTEIVGFDVEDGPSALVELIKKNHISYIPIYEKSIDRIIGMISAQAFMLSDRKDIHVSLQPAFFIPETKRIDELYMEFQKDDRDVAIAVDEHGGTAGLVTDEDILEEIFGEIYDEFEQPKTPVRKVSNHEFLVEGKISLHDFNEHFSAELTSPSEETLAGFVMETLGHIPTPGETCRFDRGALTVMTVDGRRIDQIKVTVS